MPLSKVPANLRPGQPSRTEEQPAGLERPVDLPAVGQFVGPDVLEQPSLDGAVGAIGLGPDVVGAALEDRERRGLAGHRGDELDGACAVADHGHPAAVELAGVVPAGRMEAGPFERLPAGQVGGCRSVELSAGEDHHVGDDLAGHRPSRRHRQAPLGVLLVEVGLVHRGAEPDVPSKVVLGHARLGVVEDLRLFGEAPGPVRLWGERERVQVGGDIAPAAGVCVVTPGAAHAVGLLVDGDVGDARTP